MFFKPLKIYKKSHASFLMSWPFEYLSQTISHSRSFIIPKRSTDPDSPIVTTNTGTA